MSTTNCSADSRRRLPPDGLVLRAPTCRHFCPRGKNFMRSATRHVRDSPHFTINGSETWPRMSYTSWNGGTLSFRRATLAGLVPLQAYMGDRPMGILQMVTVPTDILRRLAAGARSPEGLRAAWVWVIHLVALLAVRWPHFLLAKDPWVGRRR